MSVPTRMMATSTVAIMRLGTLMARSFRFKLTS